MSRERIVLAGPAGDVEKLDAVSSSSGLIKLNVGVPPNHFMAGKNKVLAQPADGTSLVQVGDTWSVWPRIEDPEDIESMAVQFALNDLSPNAVWLREEDYKSLMKHYGM